jgi:nickel/cobalt transporter (NiCoT) family protein
LTARFAWTRALSRAEWLRLSSFGGGVVLLHLLGWGLFWLYSRGHPGIAGLGTLAYTFGLRHAFDADHIAAIDNTTRKFLQDGKRSLGVGFFSLGHSTIVFAFVAALAVAAPAVSSMIPVFQSYGGYVSAGVSGTFLWISASSTSSSSSRSSASSGSYVAALVTLNGWSSASSTGAT